MGQEIATYTKVLTHPINVSFTCEHCGEFNSFSQEIVGSGKKSKYGAKHEVSSSSVLSQKDLDKIMMKAQKNLDSGIKSAESKIAKGKFSWLYANKCLKCKYYQSWHTWQIWKYFLKTFFGGPLILLLLVMLPLSIFFGRDTNKYPDWIFIALGVMIFIVLISAIVNLFLSLIHRDRKQRNKPTVTI